MAQFGLVANSEATLRTLLTGRVETVEPIMPYMRFHTMNHEATEKLVAQWLDALSLLDDDTLVHRVGVLGVLHVQESASWLAERRHQTSHASLCIAIDEVLRKLRDDQCAFCEGDAQIQCPTCGGRGESECRRCDGSASIRVVCPDPDCNAGDTMRSIDSRPCGTCRGKGDIVQRCECDVGWVPCATCDGSMRVFCPICDKG
jgi:hypothetical protein